MVSCYDDGYWLRPLLDGRLVDEYRKDFGVAELAERLNHIDIGCSYLETEEKGMTVDELVTNSLDIAAEHDSMAFRLFLAVDFHRIDDSASMSVERVFVVHMFQLQKIVVALVRKCLLHQVQMMEQSKW